MKLACNYAIVRFLPYAETGEFVNVGVALMCPEAGFFDFQLAHKRQRVTGFFKELDKGIYTAGLKYFEEELKSLRAALWLRYAKPAGTVFEKDYALGIFRELVKPRESIFRFSGARTALTDNPAKHLTTLYAYYVERQFATKEHHETVMAHRLRTLFSQYNLAHLYKAEPVGDETYSVSVPLVHRQGGKVLKAIKPLDLNRETPTKVYEHGDLWISRVKRLEHIHQLPEEMLFTVQGPAGGEEERRAFDEVCSELKALRVEILPVEDKAGVIEFAKVA
jgi:hypothetical protein